MPDTFTFEEAEAPESFSFEEAAKPEEFSFEDAQSAPVKAPDLSKLIVPPTVRGPFGESLRPESGMEPGTGLTTAIGEAIPKLGEKLAWPGKFAYASAADLVASGFDQPEYGGNIHALLNQEQLPAEKFIGETAKYSPKLAVTANLAESATEMAPMGVMGELPAWANRLIAAGFTADMIHKAPEQARELGEQLGLPEDQRDAGKIANLKSGLIQTAIFAPLAGAGALGRPVEVGLSKARQHSLNRLDELYAEEAKRTGQQDISPQRQIDALTQQETPAQPVAEPNPEAPAAAPVEEAKASPNDLVPALKTKEGKIIPGQKGNIHDDIYKAQEPIAGLELKVSEPEHGFLYNGEFKSRREAADLLGEKDPLHSETLIELQKKTSQPAAERTPEQVAADASKPDPNYSDEDWAKYQELLKVAATKMTPENMQALWTEKTKAQKSMEALKNKYGGKAPAQLKPNPSAPPAPPAAPVAPVETAATPVEAKGKIDDWITKLESLKSKGGETGLASFPDPEVFKGIGSALRNTAIDVAIGVLKAGKSIGEALDAAMTHIRERSKDFDETKLRTALGAYLNPPETTGIAHRVSEARGMAPERGQGIAPAESVEHGRELLQQGLDPQSVLDVFNKTQAVRADDMAVVRAHLERLSKATNDAADAHGVDSPEYKAAWEAEKDWRAKVKPMQTEWHRIGQAQQGETDINTGSYTGLQRLHQENTGTDFTPGQKKQGQRIAKTNKDAQQATGAAQEKFNQHIVAKTTGMTEAEARAKQAVFDVHRNIAIDMAKAENKARVADEVYKQALAKVQADAAARAQGKVTDVKIQSAIDRAKAENKARVDAAKRAKDLADVEVARVKKAHDAVIERARKAAIASAEKARKLQGDPTLRVWTKAKEYLDKGIDKLDDIVKKLATDLGMSSEQVKRLMAQDKRAKYLADDLWRKQQTERNLKSQAKRWVQNLSTPGYQKAINSIPRGMFVLKVGLHGTVALGTHAPTVAFQPRFWNAYVRNFGKMYKMVGSRAYYESQIQGLLRADNYTTARRAGLVNDPFLNEEYAMNPVVGKVATISPKTAAAINAMTGMGNRGYSVLKILRQDMFDQHWNQLPKSMQIPEVAQSIADGVNHATGVVQGRAPPGTNLALFAPRLEASRVMWLAGDPIKAAGTLINWKNASIGEKHFAVNQIKEKAWVVGTLGSMLALNQGVLSATGSNQQVNVSDPFKPDFLKFKVAGMNVSYGNPMITMARLPLRLFVGIKNEGKFNKLVYEDENVATILFEYVRSQMSPFAGTTTDLAIGRDFMRKPLPRAGFGLLPGKTNMPKRLKAEGIQPYTWTEYAAQQAAMIPLQEALKEVWGKDLNMTPESRDRALKAFATIVVMGGTGARVSEDYSLKQK